MNLSSNSNCLQISNSGIQTWKGLFLVCFCFSTRLTRSDESTAPIELLKKIKVIFYGTKLTIWGPFSKVVYQLKVKICHVSLTLYSGRIKIWGHK